MINNIDLPNFCFKANSATFFFTEEQRNAEKEAGVLYKVNTGSAKYLEPFEKKGQNFETVSQEWLLVLIIFANFLMSQHYVGQV